MASHAPKRMTLAEFLDWDDGTDRRYQLVDGVLMMMAPAIEAHGELAAALMIEIGSRLKRSCRVIAAAGIMVEGRSDTCYVADLAVTCAPREPGRRMVAEPVLIVEVVSPPAGPVDRWRKVADYRTLPSVQEILIAEKPPLKFWIVAAPIRLGVCDAPIPLDALYRDLLPGPDEAEAPSGA